MTHYTRQYSHTPEQDQREEPRKAKKSLMKMVKLEKAIHFNSPMLTPNQYTIKSEDGVMTVNTVLQSALLTKWSDESAANSKPFNSYYQETMENLFNHII